MLYGNSSISHYSADNMMIWLVMGFQGGMINVGGLMAGQHIVSHITGIATNFGLAVGYGEIGNALFLLVIPLFFLLGSITSGYLVDLRLHLKKKPKYYLSFGIMFFLLLAVYLLGGLGLFGSFGENSMGWREFLLLSLLCLVCGIQNGTITVVSKSIIRTTHLTGLTTDLGIGIVRVLNKNRINGMTYEGRSNFIRMGIIFAFASGAAIGGLLFKVYRYHAFLFPVIISGSLFLLMLYFQVLKQKDLQYSSNQ